MNDSRDIAPETATSRLELMWGQAGLDRLRRSLVVVLGVGGVGSNCVEALVRGGVGRLVIVDGDEVAPSNINRQAIAFVDTVGKRKVEAMRDLIARINPEAEVSPIDVFLRAEHVPALMDGIISKQGMPAYVVDAIDTVSAKLAVASWAAERGVPLISSMGGAMKLDPSKLRVCDLFETANDPLARVMRKGCRKRGIDRLTVLSSFEEPMRRPGGAARAGRQAGAPKAPLGTASYLPPIMGQMIAGHVIRSIIDGAQAKGRGRARGTEAGGAPAGGQPATSHPDEAAAAPALRLRTHEPASMPAGNRKA